jgi:HEAT repeat protein
MVTPDVPSSLLSSLSDDLSSPDLSVFESALGELQRLTVAQAKEVLSGLLLEPDPPLALGVARAIGELRNPELGEMLISLLREPGKWFGRSDRLEIRHAAVQSLGALRYKGSAGILLELVSTARDQELVLEAVKALSMIGDPDCVDGLLKAMIGHPPLALSAAGVVAEIGGEEAFQGLLGCLGHESDMVRSASIWALGLMRDQRAIKHLARSAADADSMLRSDAVWAIAKIGGPAARIALSEISSSDPDPSVRKEAARARESETLPDSFNRNQTD